MRSPSGSENNNVSINIASDDANPSEICFVMLQSFAAKESSSADD